MADGQLRCCGSSLFLKSRYELGIFMTHCIFLLALDPVHSNVFTYHRNHFDH